MNQEIIAGLIFVVCLAYILRKFVFKKKGSSMCDGCGKCGGGKSGCH